MYFIALSVFYITHTQKNYVLDPTSQWTEWTRKKNIYLYTQLISTRVWAVRTDFDSIKMKQRNYFPFISVDDL